ncbi:hypothetical protein ACFVJ4_13790 [Streptomyces sp. NPDC127178]|uniref:hypothetical protein n=1 Tax=unclassified Streptomyces TaxID=2593676 RepID=UPI00363E2F29
MTGQVPEIWVADLARALDAVGDDPVLQRRAARLLGFADEPPPPGPPPDPATGAPAPAPPGPPAEEPPLPPPTRRPGDGGAPPEPPPPDIGPGPSDGHTGPTGLPVLEPVRLDALEPTDWEAVRSLDEVTERHLTARPPLEPLLTRRSSAAILNAALTTLVRDDGEPDIDALVEAFARGIPLTRLPRAARPTLRFGVQVLLDQGDSMEPYRRDQKELARQITGLVGAELTQVRCFADVPARGTGPDSPRTWQPYRPPSPGTRVLVVSDLGVGGPVLHPRRASVAEWYHVLDEIVRAGCTVLALVPYPVNRVPAELAPLLSVLTWDRTTTVSTVSALVGPRR